MKAIHIHKSLSDTWCLCAGDCDFDSDLCSWTNDKSGDSFDWAQQSGSTNSGSTGPRSDHTQGNTKGEQP